MDGGVVIPCRAFVAIIVYNGCLASTARFREQQCN